MRKVCVIAGGQSVWGQRPDVTMRDLIQEGAKACFDDNKAVKPKDVDGLIYSSVRTPKIQVHPAPMVAEYIGVKPVNICCSCEALCASGSSGIIIANAMIASGQADVVMVLGGEKRSVNSWESSFEITLSNDHDFDAALGFYFPPTFFGMVAKHHMKKFGTTEEQLALVSVKNRRNGSHMPKAQQKKTVTLEECMTARAIVSPLKLNDCCPTTDGSAAIILACEERAKELTDKPLLYFKGAAQGSVNNNVANITDWSTFGLLEKIAALAYKKAGITAADIDVAQTHDCFTISEIIEYEQLGFCKPGEGGEFIQSGKSDFGGIVPVNTDGGLLANGHPLGATGLRQGIEIMHQLRGDAIQQVDGARIGLTHNLHGFAAAQTVLIYGRD